MNLGITDGFQWIDGSFLENAEARIGRPPNDIDVVTFAHRPSGVRDMMPLLVANADLFDPGLAKNKFECDGYFVDLDQAPDSLVKATTYWHGLFSHRRATYEWKGIVEVPLASDDYDANELLLAMGLGHAP